MANMIDYLVWRGELTLEASPWNEVDGLLLATLSYLNFHGIQHPKGWTLEEYCILKTEQQIMAAI